MSGSIVTQRVAGVASLAAVLLAGGCAVVEPKAERYQPPAVGSSWTVSQRSTGSYGKDAQFQVTRGEATWEGKSAIALSSSLGTTTMATPDAGRWMAVVGKDGKPILGWDPPVGWEYPLSVGKTWTTSYRITNHVTKRTTPYDLSCKVESYGDVTVPAGTFKAFKIACTTTIGTEETFWNSPELGIFVKTSLRRSDSSPFGPGTQDSELVSHEIKR